MAIKEQIILRNGDQVNVKGNLLTDEAMKNLVAAMISEIMKPVREELINLGNKIDLLSKKIDGKN